MTIEELVKLLQKYPQSTTVTVSDGYGDPSGFVEVIQDEDLFENREILITGIQE
jgi:hypothetical protein